MMDETVRWMPVCALSDIRPDSGVCALVDGRQVAVFRVGEDELYALDNYDPFSHAQVMSRGIVGDRNGVLKVASPIYKQNFDLRSGVCLGDPEVRLGVHPVRLRGGTVEVGVDAG